MITCHGKLTKILSLCLTLVLKTVKVFNKEQFFCSHFKFKLPAYPCHYSFAPFTFQYSHFHE